MNEKFKKLTVELCDELKVKSYEFLLNKLNKEEDTTNVINLVLSAHLSSLFTCMIEIASNHTEHTEKVKKFIENLTKYISTLEPIENVEVI